MHLDIGTGDGRYLVDRARYDPETAFFGIDLNHAGLAETSRKVAQGRHQRNLWFVLGSLEALPGPFEGVADSISVLFPWGSLLKAVASPAEEDFERIVRLARPRAAFDIVTAIDPVADAGQLRGLVIPGFSVDAMTEQWSRGPFEVKTFERLPRDHEFQTTWWRKIRQRETRVAWRLSLTVLC